MGTELKITKEQAEEYFYNALCNGLGEFESCSGGVLRYKEEEYKEAKRSLIEAEKDTCIEDILMQILRMGKKLYFRDIEGDGAYNCSITLESVHTMVEKTPEDHLNDMINENDDANTADAILQTVFFKEIIFG